MTVLISDGIYMYIGDVAHNMPHGKGIFYFKNGNKYVGECRYGKPDGYGLYIYPSGNKYHGFYSYGQRNGIGTYENKHYIYKGIWRNGKKHGVFYNTKKGINTYKQEWINGKCVDSTQVQYIQPIALETIKCNPKFKRKEYQVLYKNNNKKCIGCYEKPMSATNTACGHVVMCFECLSRCEECPICRCSFEKIIRLYIS